MIIKRSKKEVDHEEVSRIFHLKRAYDVYKTFGVQYVKFK